MGRPRLVVIIDGGGGDRDESPDSGRREASVRGGGRSSDICVSGSTVVGREARWRRSTCQKLVEMWYYYFLLPPRPGGRRTLSVTKAESKREVVANSE